VYIHPAPTDINCIGVSAYAVNIGRGRVNIHNGVNIGDGVVSPKGVGTDGGISYWLTARTDYWNDARTDLWNTARDTTP